jgi:simple sugar transport system ATP-binding protein
MPKTLLRMRGINKNFPGVRALDNVEFTLRPGEIHALMGENGAGKSALIKVLTGAESFESGEIRLGDSETPVINNSPQEAQSRGISTVYQEVNLCTNLTVAENLFVGRQPGRAGFVRWNEMNRRARAVMRKLGISIDVEKPFEVYSAAVQQMVAIARAVDISASALILDEPTSSLDEHEVLSLFSLIGMERQPRIGPPSRSFPFPASACAAAFIRLIWISIPGRSSAWRGFWAAGVQNWPARFTVPTIRIQGSSPLKAGISGVRRWTQ